MNPIEYLRQFRIGGFAVFDFAISFLAMALIAPFLSRKLASLGWHVPFRSWILLTIPISVLVHFLIGTITPLTKNTLNPAQHPTTLFVMILLVLASLIGVKRL